MEHSCSPFVLEGRGDRSSVIMVCYLCVEPAGSPILQGQDAEEMSESFQDWRGSLFGILAV